MSVGENIRKEREANSLTQKDLADKLFVTPQAVSRWEKGDVEPSLDALKGMAAIFHITLDELTSDSTSESLPKEETPVVPIPVKEETPAVPAPAPRLLGVCVRCGKAIYEGDPHGSGSKHVRTVGRRHQKSVSYSLNTEYGQNQDLLCQDCIDSIQEGERRAELAQQSADDHRRHLAWGWGIASGILALIIAIWVGVALLQKGQTSAGITTLCLSPLIAYLFFSLLFVLIMDNTFVSELFMEIVSLAFVKMPGIIFSFDLDGIAFLVVAKIFFAILGFLILLAVLALAVAVCGIFSLFVFPVALNREPSSF
jgi:transcriptional regulator with XRE-family HTH domain